MGRPLLICINPGENCKPGGNCEEKEDWYFFIHWRLGVVEGCQVGC
jgi:hypothetical protein